MTREKWVILKGLLVWFVSCRDVGVSGIKEVNVSDSWSVENISVLERERESSGGLRIEVEVGFYSFLGTALG